MASFFLTDLLMHTPRLWWLAPDFLMDGVKRWYSPSGQEQVADAEFLGLYIVVSAVLAFLALVAFVVWRASRKATLCNLTRVN
jgi:hypothetical protein